ncbi:hypothetical protein H632_c3323p0, partial [Helicosporidium sp. ATCC 50920]
MASAVLTPLLTRLLVCYIKSSSEGNGSELRATLSARGSLVLHNLELDLSSVLASLPGLEVRRAFVRRLDVRVPWAALTSSSVLVSLDVVEVVLRLSGPDGELAAIDTRSGDAFQSNTSCKEDASSSDSSPEPTPPAPDAPKSLGWFGGTLQSLLLRLTLGMRISVRNVVLKVLVPGDATVTLS